MPDINVEPILENTQKVTLFVQEFFEENNAPPKVILQLNIAADEIFSNIARYSGATDAVVHCSVEDNCAVICFDDNGMPYDPLLKPDPDISLSADERAIGGLGIFMVKKSMDKMHYEFLNNRNRLTIEKRW